MSFASAEPHHLAPADPSLMVDHHVDESVSLRRRRSFVVRSPAAGLFELSRIDARQSAHLDGIAVAGARGVECVRDGLDPADAGRMFVATVGAIEAEDPRALDQVLAWSRSAPGSVRGVVSAFGWVSPTRLRGRTPGWLQADDAWTRFLGLAACTLHGVDPGRSLARLIDDPDAGVRGAALRAARGCGRTDLLEHIVARIVDADPYVQVEAMCASVMLGDRSDALDAVVGDANRIDARPALHLALMCLDRARARRLIAGMARGRAQVRDVVVAVGRAGDTSYVPWLVATMRDPALARVAGQSLRSITGVDLATDELRGDVPEAFAPLVDDDPAHERVAPDEDDGLPWPDPERVASWWQRQRSVYAHDVRLFMGRPVDRRVCVEVLESGAQHQRRAAAEHLSLLDPGTPLFNVAAPAWRQRRLLDHLS